MANNTEGFEQDYNKNIDEIMNRPSGRHLVNEKKLKKWIISQASERRRIAAKALSTQIKYITHNDLKSYCKDLMNQMYNDEACREPKAL